VARKSEVTSGPLTNDTFAAYTYDARNRLLNAGGVTNAYDTMNNRVGQTYGTNTTIFVVNSSSKLPQVLMRIKNGVTNYYIYGAGLLYQVTETATTTNTLTYHYDCRGSTIALTDGNGNVTDRMEYSAYATLTYRIGTSDTPFLFNGMYGVQTDPNSLLYMNARYYNPFLCRFINPDPTGFSGGMNFYAFANGNPISYLDPFGLVSWGLLGRSAFGFVANGVVAVGGALLAETGVGAVAAVYGAYGAGANFGNIINALRDTPAGPTGPAQTLANVAYPSSQTANNVGQVLDLTANLATGNALGSEGEIASAAGLVTAAQYDFATLNFANQISTVYLGATYVDAGLTTYDAWSWIGDTSPIPSSTTSLFSSPTTPTLNQSSTYFTGSSTGK
jgi:RHS repeat-associated protein